MCYSHLIGGVTWAGTFYFNTCRNVWQVIVEILLFTVFREATKPPPPVGGLGALLFFVTRDELLSHFAKASSKDAFGKSSYESHHYQ